MNFLWKSEFGMDGFGDVGEDAVKKHNKKFKIFDYSFYLISQSNPRYLIEDNTLS